jgi:hypothetical protein
VVALLFSVKAVSPDTEVPGVDAVTSLVDQAAAVLIEVLALGNLVLRAFTSSAIFQKSVE